MPSANPLRLGIYWAALGTAALASVQRATMIAAVVILAHLLFAPASPQERLSRYRRWIPLFAVWMLYPTFMVAFVGDVIIGEAVARATYPPLLKWVALLALGCAVLAGIHLMIRWVGVHPWRRKLLALGGVLCGLVVWVTLALQDRRQLLLPYNALVPYGTAFTILLDPLSALFRMDSTQTLHYFPAWMPVGSILLGVLLVWIFWAAYLRRRPQLWIWVAWYGAALLHLLRHYSNTPPTVPSRYFYYVTPVLAVILSCSICRLFTWMTGPLRVKRTSLAALETGFLLVVAVPNLMAIPMAQWRGRMANTYLTYDDLRVARLIRDDLEASGMLSRPGPLSVGVRGVVPMPNGELVPNHTLVELGSNDNLRLAVGQIFEGASVPRVFVNESALQAGGGPLYTIEGRWVLDEGGRSISRFDQRMSAGFERLNAGDWRGGMESFHRAVKERPVLLRYLLGDLKLSDLRWLTGGAALRDWASRFPDRYEWTERRAPKLERTRRIVEEEIWDQITGLFLVSYLMEEQGRTEEARRWMAQIRFLESDPEVLASHLARHPEIQGHPLLLQHLGRFREPAYFQEPIPWQKDDFGIERFLLRFLTGWDVLSRWEQGGAMAL